MGTAQARADRALGKGDSMFGKTIYEIHLEGRIKELERELARARHGLPSDRERSAITNLADVPEIIQDELGPVLRLASAAQAEMDPHGRLHLFSQARCGRGWLSYGHYIDMFESLKKPAAAESLREAHERLCRGLAADVYRKPGP